MLSNNGQDRDNGTTRSTRTGLNDPNVLSDLPNPKPEHTTGGSGRGAQRRGGRAGEARQFGTPTDRFV